MITQFGIPYGLCHSIQYPVTQWPTVPQPRGRRARHRLRPACVRSAGEPGESGVESQYRRAGRGEPRQPGGGQTVIFQQHQQLEQQQEYQQQLELQQQQELHQQNDLNQQREFDQPQQYQEQQQFEEQGQYPEQQRQPLYSGALYYGHSVPYAQVRYLDQNMEPQPQQQLGRLRFSDSEYVYDV